MCSKHWRNSWVWPKEGRVPYEIMRHPDGRRVVLSVGRRRGLGHSSGNSQAGRAECTGVYSLTGITKVSGKPRGTSVLDPTKSKLSQSITSTKSFGDTAANFQQSVGNYRSLYRTHLRSRCNGDGCSFIIGHHGAWATNLFPCVFPVLVLVFFIWIVIFKPVHLFSPRDFRDEENYNYFTLVASLTAAAIKSPDGAIIEGKLDVHKIAETARNLLPRPRPDHLRIETVYCGSTISQRTMLLSAKRLRRSGISFALALSSQQALDLTKGNSFSAIISDMGRREGAQEGYKLLQTLRTQGNVIPLLFIYSSSNSAAQRREATKRGAQGSTNDPQELIQMVTTAIING